jgi:nitroreductase
MNEARFSMRSTPLVHEVRISGGRSGIKTPGMVKGEFMDTIQALFTRRTVRQFTPEPVSDEDVHLLLKAAMQAPTAGNAQPWHFVVITDHAVLDQIPTFHTSAAFIPRTPLGILICADDQIAKPGRWLLDCAAAAENMLIAAHASGLGACWVGIEPVPERIEGFRRLIGLPDSVHPVCMIAVGHPAKTPAPEDRFQSERVHLNNWNTP